jgi:uncharacterized repeat protein (TIGR03803 family)
VLHSFDINDPYTYNPIGSLIIDSRGNLYGTTSQGGEFGGGAAFEMRPVTGGNWTFKLLHMFGQTNDGYVPYSNLSLDASGNLYGTTVNGGAFTIGTVFELTPTAGGDWSETMLHTFCGNNGNPFDGAYPYNGLVLDASDNLYGVTFNGGANNQGMVFEIAD